MVYFCPVQRGVFAHHQSSVCGAITEIRPSYSNGCPGLSALILCQDNKLKAKSENDVGINRGEGSGVVHGLAVGNEKIM